MSPEITTVLAGTALTLHSDPVVAASAEIAQCTDTELHLLHAYSPPVAYFAAPSGLTTFDPQLLEAERRLRDGMMDEQLERLELEREALAGTSVLVGAPHRLLLEIGRELEADLLVVGSSEESTPHLLGSTADRVLRKANCPVLVVRGDFTLPPTRVLAPIDLSEHSEDSLRRGLLFLDAWCAGKCPEIMTLFVLSEDELRGSSQFTSEQIARLAHDEMVRFIARVDPEGERGMHLEVRTGEPRQEILRELEEVPADLVLLGTHGRGGFERFLLGSVATDVAGRAPTSALVIPPSSGESGEDQ